MSVQTKATKFGYGVFNVENDPYGIMERGLRGVCKQLFAMGEIKIGTLKGQDEHGNMYYENLQYQLGRHRWVEYAGWHWRFDYTQISPAWLGWLASSYDETPDEQAALLKTRCKEIKDLTTLNNSSNPAETNMGGVISPHHENLTAMKYRSYRQWGFKDAQKQDQYWLPETHPLYMENARPIPHYIEEWDPKSA